MNHESDINPSDSSPAAANQNSQARFRTTRWSIVLAAQAGRGGSLDSDTEPSDRHDDWKDSLEKLCNQYWYPLYAYLRRKGYSPSDSQDLTQDFLAALIEKDFLKSVDEKKGRFRWFMMDAMKKFAANWNAAKSAQKRGGGRQFFSLQFDDGESRYSREPVDGWTAERLFERQWTISLLQSALDALQSDYEDAGKTRHFETLKIFLTPDTSPPTYSEVAEQLGLSLTAVKVAIHRLRDKYRESVHQQVANTLNDDESLEDEINRLLDTM